MFYQVDFQEKTYFCCSENHLEVCPPPTYRRQWESKEEARKTLSETETERKVKKKRETQIYICIHVFFFGISEVSFFLRKESKKQKILSDLVLTGLGTKILVCLSVDLDRRACTGLYSVCIVHTPYISRALSLATGPAQKSDLL